ncbi:MAG TPA: hypothetical protein VIG08_13020 [Gemmatimonadales bacterium]
MRPAAFALLLACMIEGVAPRPIASQQSLGIGPVTGGSFERFGTVSNGPIAFSYKLSRLTNAGPAEDFAFRFFPEALSAGVALLGVDAGVMQAVAVGPVGLFVNGGASCLAVLGMHGSDLAPGFAVGGGTLIRLQRRAALRVDITRHNYFEGGERYAVWAFGIGLSALPPAGRN